LRPPDLAALDLPAVAAAAGYPGTSVIPAVSWLLSLLALKLTRSRRVSHVDDLLADPPPRYWPGWRCCRRNPRSPATPTGPPTTASKAPARPGCHDDRLRLATSEKYRSKHRLSGITNSSVVTS
jgi:hypothetical protein